ncbi:MAG: LCP family protein [Clostridia bacterium]|nr:LCP family protein [Clostridia bacterium]
MNSLRTFLITFGVSLLVFGLCAFFITGVVLGSITDMISGDRQAQTDPVDTDEFGEVVLNVKTPLEDISGESFSILLIGTDYRPSLYTDYHPALAKQYPMLASTASLVTVEKDGTVKQYRTVSADAVMLISVNKEKQSVTILQIPSEMQLSVGGVNVSVGELYYLKGLDYFINKMAGITGTEINYYALTDIERLAAVVDAMDTVNFTVPCDMEYTDEISGLTISLPGGTQDLDGSAVAQMLAFDGYTSASFSRNKTALSFLRALATKMTNAVYMRKAVSIFNNAGKYIYTNFTADDFGKNIDLIFCYNRFTQNILEYPGNYYYRDGVRCFSPNISMAISTMESYK